MGGFGGYVLYEVCVVVCVGFSDFDYLFVGVVD